MGDKKLRKELKKHYADIIEEYDITLHMQGSVLTAAVNELRGPPAPSTAWSVHDVHELVHNLVEEHRALMERHEAVLELHQPNGSYWPGGLDEAEYCKHDRKPWPCPTVIAIKGET